MNVGKAWKNLVTGIDNETHDLGRVALVIGVLSLCGFTGWDMYYGRPFNATGYGTAFGAIVAAVGANLWLKKDTEPNGQK